MDRPTGLPFATRSEVLALHGAAATSQPLATDAALDVLKEDGNAFDAAIAANAVLCVVEPTGCGIGGDLFALVHDASTGEVLGLNASGRSPAGLATRDLCERVGPRIPADGPLSITTPGCVDGWHELHARLGRLPLARLLEPAIAHAREGFPVSEVIAHHWARGAERLRDQPGFAGVFLPGGRAPRKGELFQNPALAGALETLANEGRDAFYRGELAAAIARHVTAAGGALSAEDLAAHRSDWVTPLATTYRGVELLELPPNTQGFTALQMLNVLERFDLASHGFGSADHLHAFVEAKKLAYEDRARWCADPAFCELPLERLVSKAYAAELAARIDPARAARDLVAGDATLEGPGDTVYLAVADREGNLASLIQSNFRGFGSGVTPPELGSSLQDRGELFDLRPGRPNSHAPGKRPFHTIVPAMLRREGAPWAAFGVMGGATQPQAHAWIVCNKVDFGMNWQEAGDAPRVVHEGSSSPTGERMRGAGVVRVESGFREEALRELLLRGHEVARGLDVFGGYQAVARDPATGVLAAATESRKDGTAAGY